MPFPVGQSIKDGYNGATDPDLPFTPASAQFDTTIPENALKPNRLWTITNSGVLQSERVFSATAANADRASALS